MAAKPDVTLVAGLASASQPMSQDRRSIHNQQLVWAKASASSILRGGCSCRCSNASKIHQAAEGEVGGRAAPSPWLRPLPHHRHHVKIVKSMEDQQAWAEACPQCI